MLFWGLAIAKMLLSVPVQSRAVQAREHALRAMRKGQRQDDWLACILMWMALLCETRYFKAWVAEEFPGDTALAMEILHGGVYFIGTVVVAWLLRRTLARLRILEEHAGRP